MDKAGRIRKISYGLCVCNRDNPLAKVRGLSPVQKRKSTFACVTVLCQVRHCVEIYQLSYCLSICYLSRLNFGIIFFFKRLTNIIYAFRKKK